jgi:hypothetical protein
VLNKTGYDFENRMAGMSPTRKTARKLDLDFELKNKKITTKYHPWHLLQTILTKNKSTKEITDFVSEIKKLSRHPKINSAWKKILPEYKQEIDRIYPEFVREAEKLSKITAKSTPFKKLVLVVNLLESFWTGYCIKENQTAFIVLGPGATDNKNALIKHELLHLLANQFKLPSKTIKKHSEKEIKKLASLGYAGTKILTEEYLVRGLQIILFEKNKKLAIKRENKYFPQISEAIEVIKKNK